MNEMRKLIAEKLIRLAVSGENCSIPATFHEVEATPEIRRAIREEKKNVMEKI